MNTSPKAIQLDDFARVASTLRSYGANREAAFAYSKAIEVPILCHRVFTRQVFPNVPALFVNLGVSLDDTGDFQGAVKAYQDAISLDSKFREAYRNLAMTYRSHGQMCTRLKSHLTV
jgi:tetratricopeptide (TPR) repeat protein